MHFYRQEQIKKQQKNPKEELICKAVNIYYWNTHGFSNALDLTFQIQPNDLISLSET